MKTPALKNCIKIAGILFGGVFLGTLILILIYCLPVTERNVNAVASMEILNTEGWYPTLPLVESFDGEIDRTNKGGILDNYTDSIMISMAAANSNGRPWYQAMKMESNVMEQGYSYYWHGYVTILRPLLLLFDYGEIRVLNEMAQLLLVITLFSLLKRRKGTAWGFVSLSVYGLLFPMTLTFSLQYSWVFYIEIIASIVLIRFEDFWRRQHNIYYLFLLVGMMTSYFDLLTYPLITWGLPVIWWLALDDKKNSEMSRIKDVICSGLFWILGYGGMWAGKWLIGELIIDEPIVSVAWNEVLYRAGALEGTDGSGVSHLSVILRNFEQCNSVQYLSILSAWFVWFIYRFWNNRGKMKTQKALSFFVVSMSTFAWYIILHNHTFVHATFTYRIFIVFFMAILGCLVSGTEEETNVVESENFIAGERVVTDSHRKCFILRYVLLMGLLLLALFIALLDRQTVWRHNGETENVPILMENGQVIEQKFVPMYRDVTALQVGIGAEGALKGNFIVAVCREENVLFTQEIPAVNVAGGSFYEVDLGLRLKKGEPYLIRLSLENNEGTQGIVTLTTEGDYALSEFDAVSVNGSKMDAQMIGGLIYNTFPDMSKLVINFLTVAGFLSVAYLGILNMTDVLSSFSRRISRKTCKEKNAE